VKINRGILFAFGAYGIWGFLPAFWKALQEVPAPQILSHRILWSFFLLVGVLAIRKEIRPLKTASASTSIRLALTAAALLLGTNWLIYIWAVNAGFIVETSLGYFINPLVNVLLGVVFLRERLRPLQWVPIALAAAGVLYMTLATGVFPWISLALAFTFAMYGLLKKLAPIGALQGLTAETGVLVVPSFVFLGYLLSRAEPIFGPGDPVTVGLLLFSGGLTAVPLLLFGGAARRINLSTLGLIQYIAPSIQLLLGVLVYNEPFSLDKAVGFSMIWTALFIYSVEGIIFMRRTGIEERKKRDPQSLTEGKG
jgi:chloramphenicol-sensitive protein RarD